MCVYGQHIVSGNEAEVKRLLSESENEEDGRKLCHPLCSCDACDRHISGSVLTNITYIIAFELIWVTLYIRCLIGSLGEYYVLNNKIMSCWVQCTYCVKLQNTLAAIEEEGYG